MWMESSERRTSSWPRTARTRSSRWRRSSTNRLKSWICTTPTITKVSTDLQTARFGNMQMQPVVQTMWKFENGNWYWFDPSVNGTNSVDTPFGKMTFGPATASGPTILGQKRISVEEVLHSVSAD